MGCCRVVARGEGQRRAHLTLLCKWVTTTRRRSPSAQRRPQRVVARLLYRTRPLLNGRIVPLQADDVELKAVHPSVGSLLAWRYCQLLTALPKRSTGGRRGVGGWTASGLSAGRAAMPPLTAAFAGTACGLRLCLLLLPVTQHRRTSPLALRALQTRRVGRGWRECCLKRRPSGGLGRRRRLRLARWTRSRWVGGGGCGRHVGAVDVLAPVHWHRLLAGWEPNVCDAWRAASPRCRPLNPPSTPPARRSTLHRPPPPSPPFFCCRAKGRQGGGWCWT